MLKKYHTFEIANAVNGTFTRDRDPNNHNSNTRERVSS